MISINIHYSPDRYDQLKLMLECLSDVDMYSELEIIICCDDVDNIDFGDFKKIVVKKKNGLYSRPVMWIEGVKASNNDIVVYLDSDRIVSKDFFKKVYDRIKPNQFLFPLFHYHLPEGWVKGDEIDLSRPDHRNLNPWATSVKNPMSGCVAFLKETFNSTGGPDRRYKGWRFCDTDYYLECFLNGYEFVPFVSKNDHDLHIYHPYEISDREMKIMFLRNGIKYCKKWNLEYPKYFYNYSEKYNIDLKRLEKSFI